MHCCCIHTCILLFCYLSSFHGKKVMYYTPTKNKTAVSCNTSYFNAKHTAMFSFLLPLIFHPFTTTTTTPITTTTDTDDHHHHHNVATLIVLALFLFLLLLLLLLFFFRKQKCSQLGQDSLCAGLFAKCQCPSSNGGRNPCSCCCCGH